MNTEKLPTRFWAKVNKTNGCWLWKGAKSGGFGIMRINGGFRRATHISVYLHHGAWPAPGLEVMHLCDATACVRPEHLVVGTRRDNIAARDARWRKAFGARCGHVKLREADVLAMRQMYATGQYTHADLKALFNMSNVSDILNHKSWKHI